MKKILAGIILLGLLIANPVLAKEGVTPMLKMSTSYNFMFPSEFLPSAPFVENSEVLYALAWEGTIQGDVSGVIRWWVEFSFSSGFAAGGRVEIWDCEPVFPSECDFADPALLIMAGYETFGYVSDTDWKGKGIVTYAREDYAGWYGHRYTDGGWVEFDEATGFPVYGEGPFVIYDRPSQKH
jgi:hypothetical protein